MKGLTTLALAALASMTAATKATTTPPCTTTTPTTSCSSTICADYVNSCGQTYGGCYPACSGYTTPSFTDPGCPTVTSSSSTLSATASCTQTICADYVNECGQWYGGCYPACSGYPTPSFSEPPCSTSSGKTKTKTRKPCTKTMCVDYVNDCGIMYGGCFKACRGHKTPSFTDPGCPATTYDPVTSDPITSDVNSADCPFVCRDYFDDCGNTFGPGCYTSCPGAPVPTYTTPVCNTDAGTYTTA